MYTILAKMRYSIQQLQTHKQAAEEVHPVQLAIKDNIHKIGLNEYNFQYYNDFITVMTIFLFHTSILPPTINFPRMNTLDF